MASAPATAAQETVTCATDPSVGDLTTLGTLREGARVLIVGDGNFSFARAFLRRNAAAVTSGALHVTASSLDSREQLAQMYPQSAAVLADLAVGGVTVRHEVDATRLETRPELAGVDRVVFNFPHFAAGGNKRNKINRHRQLLREFFMSARQVMADDGQIWVTLCNGQGGTPMDTTQRAWGDTWQVVHCAAEAGLLLTSAHRCPVDKLAELGYASVGYQLREQAFWTTDSVSHVFVKEEMGVAAQFPITWTRAISFWVDDDKVAVDAFVRQVLRDHFPPPMELVIEQVDEYACEASGRTAATYRLEIACSHLALSRERVNDRTIRALQTIENSPFASPRT